MLARRGGRGIAREAVKLAQHPFENRLVDVLGTVRRQLGRCDARQVDRAGRHRGPILDVLRGGRIEAAGRLSAHGDVHVAAGLADGQLRIELGEIAEPGDRQGPEIHLLDIHLLDVGVAGGEHPGRLFGRQGRRGGRAHAPAARCEQKGDERRRERRTGGGAAKPGKPDHAVFGPPDDPCLRVP